MVLCYGLVPPPRSADVDITVQTAARGRDTQFLTVLAVATVHCMSL